MQGLQEWRICLLANVDLSPRSSGGLCCPSGRQGLGIGQHSGCHMACRWETRTQMACNRIMDKARARELKLKCTEARAARTLEVRMMPVLGLQLQVGGFCDRPHEFGQIGMAHSLADAVGFPEMEPVVAVQAQHHMPYGLACRPLLMQEP